MLLPRRRIRPPGSRPEMTDPIRIRTADDRELFRRGPVDALRTFLLAPTSDLHEILENPWPHRLFGAPFGSSGLTSKVLRETQPAGNLTQGWELVLTERPDVAITIEASMWGAFQLGPPSTSQFPANSTEGTAIPGNGGGGVSNSEPLRAHFVGGLRRPASIGSVTYSWPLIGLYIYSNHLEFGPGFKFMRRLSPPVKSFKSDDIELVGPTNHGVRFTFRNGESWIFGRSNISAVMSEMEKLGVKTTKEVIPAHWMPPL